MIRTAAVFQFVLMISTWPLWWGSDSFPSVPLFAVLRDVPVAVDRVFVALFVAAVGILAVRPDVDESKWSRLVNFAAVLAGVLLVAINQHRLQPWNVLFLMLAATNPVVEARCRVTVWRVTIAMVYLCAALSRIGPGIDEGISRQILETGLSATGLSRLSQSTGFVRTACVTMSAVEFTAGILLLTRRFRIVGIVLAIAIHATLLLALSPIGLNHNVGVLAWNTFFLLFLPLLRERGAASFQARLPTRLMIIAVVLFPLSGLVGIADNWPSWQLYSPRPEVLKVYLKADAVEQLPEAVREFVGEPAPLDDWYPVRVDLWSLAETGAPVYPEDRFQLAVATALATYVENPTNIQAVLNEPRQPLWWQRRKVTLSGVKEFRQAADRFLLNAAP